METKPTTAKSTNPAIERVSASLQELRGQLIWGETQAITKKTGLDRVTVDKYLRGEVSRINIASNIIKTARKIIIKREQQASA